MFNFAQIANSDFEAFVRIYKLPPFVPIKQTCEVCHFGKTKLYELHAAGVLIVRKLGGQSGVFASEIYAYLNSAEPFTLPAVPRASAD